MINLHKETFHNPLFSPIIFYLTVQRTDRIVEELKASATRLDWVGWVGTEKNREAAHRHL